MSILPSESPPFKPFLGEITPEMIDEIFF